MCLAIVQHSLQALPLTYFKTAWSANSDGAGFAYATGGQVRIERGFWKLDDLWGAYKRVRASADGPMLIHFRYATHGDLTEDNCHPHPVGDSACIHNGIIAMESDDPHDPRSDTRQFLDWTLSQYPKDWYAQRRYRRAIKPFVEGSKLCFLRPSGKVHIVNAELGHWNGPDWFSNHSYVQTQSWFRSKSSYGKPYGDTSGALWDKWEDWPGKDDEWDGDGEDDLYYCWHCGEKRALAPQEKCLTC